MERIDRIDLIIHYRTQEDILPPSSSKKESIEFWGINWKLDIFREAAEFYTLVDLSIDFPDVVKMKLDTQANKLAIQFSRYLDMAIGGELRHTEVSSKFYEDCYERDFPILWLKLTMLHGSRAEAWTGWAKIRKAKGIPALEEAREVFAIPRWDSAYGGKSWGNATEVLVDYLTGNMSVIMFVDTVFSLHHNNNIILDKAWRIDRLDTLLTAVLDGEIDKVAAYATTSTRQLYNELRGKKIKKKTRKDSIDETKND